MYDKIRIRKNNDDLIEMQNFTKKNLNGKLENYINNKKIINPKISIIISLFNGEAYIKPVVRSIQNQDFFDV